MVANVFAAAADSETNQAKATSISLPAISSQTLAWAEELGEAARNAAMEQFNAAPDVYGRVPKPSLNAYNAKPICVLAEPPRRKKRDRQGRSKSQKKASEESKLSLPYIPLSREFKSQAEQEPKSARAAPEVQKNPRQEEKRQQELQEWRHGIAESALRFARTADVPLSQLQNFGTFALD